MSEKKINNNASPKEPVVDFGALYNKYKRYWWMFVASLVLCVSVAGLYLYAKSPVYLVVSSVLVAQDDNSSSAGASLLKSLSIGGAGSKVDDEVIVMGSEELCSQTINALKLNRTYMQKKGLLKKIDYYNNSPVEIDAPDQLFDTLAISMKFKIDVNKDGTVNIKVKKGRFKTLANVKDAKFPVVVKTGYGFFSVNKTKFFTPGKSFTINASVTGNVPCSEALQKLMTVKIMSKKSNAIYLDVEETNVKRGKDILNTIIRLYNERGQNQKNEMAVNTGKFIDDRLTLIYKDLTSSEADIESYKKAHKIVDVDTQVKTLIGKQGLAEQSAIKLETRYRIVRLIKEFINNPANNFSYIPFDADSTAAQGAVKEYNSLVVKRTKLMNSAKPNSQVMQALDSQIESMRDNVARGVNNTLLALKIQIDRANSIDDSSLGMMGDMPTQEREARSLYRQQGIQNTLYTFLLQKREENALLLAATTPKGEIVDHAYPQSEPIKPKSAVVLFIALVMAILIPFFILYVKNLFTTKFSTQEELEDIIQVPVLGEICHNRHHSDLVVKAGKTSSIVELFRLIRNNIQFMLPSADDKLLLVTSSVSGEGKSFVSANVAASFALLGKKVALVGMDIRSPKLSEMLGLNAVPGVTSYLAKSDTKIDEIKQKLNAVDGVDVYVGGAIPPNPSELLLSERVKQLFDELRAQYDIIVVDSAPIAMVSDTFSLVNYANAVIYVTRANYTKRSLIKYLNSVVHRGQIKNVAAVLNDSNPRLSQGYGYGYGQDEDK
jgi:tyrosine-protein kinase Etk/Wzc